MCMQSWRCLGSEIQLCFASPRADQHASESYDISIVPWVFLVEGVVVMGGFAGIVLVARVSIEPREAARAEIVDC